MAIFGKKAVKDDKPSMTSQKAPELRPIYVPQYAVRDALQCSPTSWKQDNFEAFRKAHQDRTAREQSEGYSGWSTPRLSPGYSPATSRNNSALSLPMMEMKRSASPYGPASYSSQVPLPAFPQQYAVQLVGPSMPYHRSQSMDEVVHAQSNAQASNPAMPSPVMGRHRLAYRHSYNTGHNSPPPSPRRSVGGVFASTPLETPEEPSLDDLLTPYDSPNFSARSSIRSSSSSENAIETPSRYQTSDFNQYSLYPVNPVESKDANDLEQATMVTIQSIGSRGSTHESFKSVDVPSSPVTPEPALHTQKKRFGLIRRNQQPTIAA